MLVSFPLFPFSIMWRKIFSLSSTMKKQAERQNWTFSKAVFTIRWETKIEGAKTRQRWDPFVEIGKAEKNGQDWCPLAETLMKNSEALMALCAVVGQKWRIAMNRCFSDHYSELSRQSNFLKNVISKRKTYNNMFISLFDTFKYIFRLCWFIIYTLHNNLMNLKFPILILVNNI